MHVPSNVSGVIKAQGYSSSNQFFSQNEDMQMMLNLQSRGGRKIGGQIHTFGTGGGGGFSSHGLSTSNNRS